MTAEPGPTNSFLSSVILHGPIPKHIALIMDGNRRYAKRHNMKTLMGHTRGAKSLENILEFCFQAGVRVVTIYAFSIENFKRPKDELDHLTLHMPLQLSQNGTIGGLLRRYGRSVRAFGRLDMMDESTRDLLMGFVNDHRDGTEGVVNICVAYTSQDEMARAIRKTVEGYSSLPSSITCQSLTQNMDSADFPSPDLLVRTSGVTRMSDFLLWQCHQETEIRFVDRLWPEFKPWDLFLILVDWQRKQAVSEGVQSKRTWKKAGYLPLSAHIQVFSVIFFIMLLILAVI